MEEIIARGLEGVVAVGTRVSDVDGERGELTIAGFPVEELAPHATYEEALFLLWHDRLPSAVERRRAAPPAGRAALASCRHPDALPGGGRGAPLPIMDALRMAVDTLQLDGEPAGAAIASESAARDRDRRPRADHRRDLRPPARRARRRSRPRADSATPRTICTCSPARAARAERRARARDLPRHRDRSRSQRLDLHGAVVVSTRSDIVSAIVGALGALQGAAARRRARAGARHGVRDPRAGRALRARAGRRGASVDVRGAGRAATA